jgi:hypothetical protein
MDTNIYIACLRQVVAFAPQVIKMRRLRRRTREGAEVWADGAAEDVFKAIKLLKLKPSNLRVGRSRSRGPFTLHVQHFSSRVDQESRSYLPIINTFTHSIYPIL